MERRRNMRLTSQDLATLQASLELGRHLSDTDLSAGHVHELLACLPAAYNESALLSFFARLLNLLRRLAPSGLFDGATGPSIRDLIVRQARAQREKVGKDVWSNDVRRSLGAVLNFVLNAASPNTPAASRASFGSAGISRALADIGGLSPNASTVSSLGRQVLSNSRQSGRVTLSAERPETMPLGTQTSNVGPAAFLGPSSFANCGTAKLPANLAREHGGGTAQRVRTAPAMNKAQRRLYQSKVGGGLNNLREWRSAYALASTKDGKMARDLKARSGKDASADEVHKAGESPQGGASGRGAYK